MPRSTSTASSKGDFSGPISANTGTGNGLDAIAFHGSTADGKPLNWKTVGASGALGYLVGRRPGLSMAT